MAKKTISFVATEELAEWIEEESERRMTTVSSAAQQLLVERFRQEQRQAEPSQDASAGAEEPDALEEARSYQFPTKEAADAFRGEVSDKHLSESDDRRLKRVTLAEGTPGEVVRRAAFEIGEEESSEDGE